MEDDLRHIYDVSLFNISDLDVLLHEILKQTRNLIGAEAGTIYVNNKDYLKFHVFQNDALSYEEIYRFYHAFKDFKFPLSKDDDRYLAVDAYMKNKIIVVDDVYNNDKYDFLGIKEFDAKFKYRTHSIITVPLVHPLENKSLGVIQLLNKKEDDKFVKFSSKDKEVLSMFASFISLSISKARNDVNKLKELNDRLKETNDALEEKILEEIDNSENKSAIIFHQSKMASMGEMIGNIAHKWREPLSTISTVASGISLDLQLDNLDKKSAVNQLDKIVNTTQKLSGMIDEFKDFYNVDSIKETFNISSSIKDSLEIANSVLELNKISKIVNLDESIETYGLKNEFVQSVLNLITNAKDNLLKNVSINDKRLIFIDLYKNENEIILKITDNANGIEDEIIKEIFDSTSSNSMPSESGIGLFMTKLIVENHMNGMIKFENLSFTYEEKEYEGTQFIITLA